METECYKLCSLKDELKEQAEKTDPIKEWSWFLDIDSLFRCWHVVDVVSLSFVFILIL